MFRTVDAFEEAGRGAVSGTIVVDPQFVDPGAGDFRLAPDSPVRGASTDGADSQRILPVIDGCEAAPRHVGSTAGIMVPGVGCFREIHELQRGVVGPSSSKTPFLTPTDFQVIAVKIEGNHHIGGAFNVFTIPFVRQSQEVIGFVVKFKRAGELKAVSVLCSFAQARVAVGIFPNGSVFVHGHVCFLKSVLWFELGSGVRRAP